MFSGPSQTSLSAPGFLEERCGIHIRSYKSLRINAFNKVTDFIKLPLYNVVIINPISISGNHRDAIASLLFLRVIIQTGNYNRFCNREPESAGRFFFQYCDQDKSYHRSCRHRPFCKDRSVFIERSCRAIPQRSNPTSAAYSFISTEEDFSIEAFIYDVFKGIQVQV